MNAPRFTVVGEDRDAVEDAVVETRSQRERDLIELDSNADTAGEELDLDVARNPVDDAAASPDDGRVRDPFEVPPVPTIPTSHPRVSESVRYMLDRYGMTSATEFPSTIAVVSALRKEGVTTVSQSVAEVLGVDFGYTVCWVDLSWAGGVPAPRRGLRGRRRHRRDRSPGDARRPGILDVVGGELALDDVLRTSPDSKVAHLDAGRTSESLREITRSVEIHDLFDELMSRFEIVVFDSAPVSENSSALSLIQCAEAYVFVTQYGATTAQQVDDATEMLDPLPVMGAVLNAYRSRTPRFIRRFFTAER